MIQTKFYSEAKYDGTAASPAAVWRNIRRFTYPFFR